MKVEALVTYKATFDIGDLLPSAVEKLLEKDNGETSIWELDTETKIVDVEVAEVKSK